MYRKLGNRNCRNLVLIPGPLRHVDNGVRHFYTTNSLDTTNGARKYELRTINLLRHTEQMVASSPHSARARAPCDGILYHVIFHGIALRELRSLVPFDL